MPVFIFHFVKIIIALGLFLVLHIPVCNLSVGDVLKKKSDLIVGDKNIIPEVFWSITFLIFYSYQVCVLFFFYSDLRNEKWYQR